MWKRATYMGRKKAEKLVYVYSNLKFRIFETQPIFMDESKTVIVTHGIDHWLFEKSQN